MQKRSRADVAEEPAHGGTARKWVLIRQGEAESDFIYLNEATLDPRRTIPAHQHVDMEEFFYFLTGEGRLRVGTETEPVRAGDRVIVPAQAAHELTNDGAVPLRFISFGVRVRLGETRGGAP